MRATNALMLIAAALIAAAAGTARAHGTACCDPKPCPFGEVAVPGDTPDDAQCCTTDDPPACTSVKNAGWACVKDVPANVQAIPGREAFAGCVDGESDVCVGGAITPAGASGCVGLSAAFVAGSNPEASGPDCTAAAVDACCESGACEVREPETEH